MTKSTDKTKIQLACENAKLRAAIRELIEECTGEIAPDGYRSLKEPSRAAIRAALAALDYVA